MIDIDERLDYSAAELRKVIRTMPLQHRAAMSRRAPSLVRVLAIGLSVATLFGLIVAAQRSHDASESSVENASVSGPEAVELFNRFTIDAPDWPLVAAASRPDGSTHLKFIDLVGKQAAGTELGGGTAEIWTGPAAGEVFAENITSGVFGTPEPIDLVGVPATLYSREQFSWIVMWKTADGSDAALVVGGPRDVNIRVLLTLVRGITDADWNELAAGYLSSATSTTAPSDTIVAFAG